MGVLGNTNANLDADDYLYLTPPLVDSNGIAYLLAGPVIYGDGPYQYANDTIWPQAKTESYAAPGISNGLTVSASTSYTCRVNGPLV